MIRQETRKVKGLSSLKHERAYVAIKLAYPQTRGTHLLDGEAFTDETYRRLYLAIEKAGPSEDPLFSVMDALEKLQVQVDHEFLSELAQEPVNGAGLGNLQAKLQELATRRKASLALFESADKLIDLSEDPSTILNELLAQAKEFAHEAGEYRPSLETCVLDLPALQKMEIPERQKIFSWLCQGGLVMLYGPRGIGKTFFVLFLAIAAACNRPFMKWGKPSEPVGVLVIDGEMALADLRERLTSLLPGKPVEPLKILSGEVAFTQFERDLNFVNSDTQEGILKILDNDKRIRLLIIDNISCLFRGIKESSKDDWEKVTPWLLAIRRRGVAVVLVHHAGKGGDQRGTSGREDMLDTVVKLGSVQNDVADGAKFTVTFTKSRGAYGEDVKPFEASLSLGTPESWTWRPIEDSTYDRMLALARDGIDTVSDMADELKVSKGLVSRLKKKAIEQGDLLPGRMIHPVENEKC
ncbi:MAG: AAA family ATPase [Deltaproteobacteria bacterium]|nr:AAA family ATPase [Deltaproteobacteria bacterium]